MAPVVRALGESARLRTGRRRDRPAPRDAGPGQRALRHPPRPRSGHPRPRADPGGSHHPRPRRTGAAPRRASDPTRWSSRATPRRPSRPRSPRSTQQVPVVHVEAGCAPATATRRSRRRSTAGSPPSSRPCTWRPPPVSRANLLARGHRPGRHRGHRQHRHRRAARRSPSAALLRRPGARRRLDAATGRLLLVTAHRRESWGEPMRGSGRALAGSPDAPRPDFVLPGAPQPGGPRGGAAAAGRRRPTSWCTEPLPYGGVRPAAARPPGPHRLRRRPGGGTRASASRCWSCGTPPNAPRPSTAGTVRLVGTDEATVRDAITALLDDDRRTPRWRTPSTPTATARRPPAVWRRSRNCSGWAYACPTSPAELHPLSFTGCGLARRRGCRRPPCPARCGLDPGELVVVDQQHDDVRGRDRASAAAPTRRTLVVRRQLGGQLAHVVARPPACRASGRASAIAVTTSTAGLSRRSSTLALNARPRQATVGSRNRPRRRDDLLGDVAGLVVVDLARGPDQRAPARARRRR